MDIVNEELIDRVPYGRKLFEVEILDEDRVEVRDLDRDDYVIMKQPKNIKHILDSKRNDVRVGSVFVIEDDNLLLDNEVNRGLNHSDKILGKVTNKRLHRHNPKRVYTPYGKECEVVDVVKGPTKRFDKLYLVKG